MRKTTIYISTAAGVLSAALFYRLTVKYGLEGALRLVWEGDHLPENARDSLSKLDRIASQNVPILQDRLEKLEIRIHRIMLNSVDDPTPSSLPPPSKKQPYHAGVEMIDEQTKRELAILSQDLDDVATKVDDAQSMGEVEVKNRKKELSDLLVGMMEEVDSLLSLCGEDVTGIKQ